MIRVEAIPILAARLEQAKQPAKQTRRHDGPEVRGRGKLIIWRNFRAAQNQNRTPIPTTTPLKATS